MEDEDSLVDQISQNIKTVKEAARVLEELKKDEQNLKKLIRTTLVARGTCNERKCLLDQNTCLDSLIGKCNIVFAWTKHRDFAKRKRRVANELCDKEKLSDSFLVIGESYQKLRNFGKARKWYKKSWNAYRSIGNLKGQALAKINIGEILDSSGYWCGALQAFKEGYTIAIRGNLTSVQISALENMHYSHMIRFDNVEKARKLQIEIQKLKYLLHDGDALRNTGKECCSETETEGDDVHDNVSSASKSSSSLEPATSGQNLLSSDDCIPLAIQFGQNKYFGKSKVTQLDTCGKQANSCSAPGEGSTRGLQQSCDNQQSGGHRRFRIVVSDDEPDKPGDEAAESDDMDQPGRRLRRRFNEDIASPEKDIMRDVPIGTSRVHDALHPCSFKDSHSAYSPVRIEESFCSRSRSSNYNVDSNASKTAANGFNLNNNIVTGKLPEGRREDFNELKLLDKDIGCELGDDLINVDINSCMDGNHLDIESVKVDVACAYHLYNERKANGLVPVITHIMQGVKVLGSLEPLQELKDFRGIVIVQAAISGWVPKRLMNLYIDYWKKSAEGLNIKLLKKLYTLEVSEDEIIVSDCGLQDISTSPFLKALQAHKSVAVLDISHNFLGNETMEKLQQIFTASTQKYGGLTLDLHCNRLGPTALFQICESPILFTRLEVLNLSENRLTDACSSYLSTILENCKALYSLSIEQCSITSRTVQKVADALHDGSVLSHLSIGKNNPISGTAMSSLFSKLSSLKRFSELDLNSIRLNKSMVDGLCQLVKSSTMSGLLLGGTFIGMDGAVMLTETLISGPQELAKLDLSYCALTHEFSNLCANIAMIGGLSELNLGGNTIGPEACDALRSVLAHPQCSLRSLFLNKCHLGMSGIVRIVQALSGNETLEELYVAENADVAVERTLSREPPSLVCSANKMEVADSEEEEDASKEPALSGPDLSFASSSHRNQFLGSQSIQELGSAIELAGHLKLLDLSRNGLPSEVIEVLYGSWSLSRSDGSPRMHVVMDNNTAHFSIKEKRCCGIKSCCRRD